MQQYIALANTKRKDPYLLAPAQSVRKQVTNDDIVSCHTSRVRRVGSS